MKILVLGYTESGKSTAAEILSELLGAKHANTSDQLIIELAASIGESPDHIRKNKSQYRMQLFNFGRAKQVDDPLWPQNIQIKYADILTGLRSPDEVAAARANNLYDIIIWITRPGYECGPTDKLDPTYADVTINNDGSIDLLKYRLKKLLEQVGPTAH